MNNFITTDLGRMPIVLDDFRFLTASLKEVINGIVSHDLTKPIILSGCVYDKEQLSDTSTLNMSAGFVMIANEIYKVNAINTSLGAGELFYWTIKSTFDPAGLKIFGSGSSYNTYNLRIAEIVKASSAPSGSTAFAPTTSMFDIYREGVKKEFKQDPMTSYAGDFAILLSSPFRAAEGVSGEVVLSGVIENTTGLSASDEIIGVIKPEYRPTSTVYTTSVVLSSSLGFVQECMITINPSGQIKFHSSLTASHVQAKLSFSCSYLK